MFKTEITGKSATLTFPNRRNNDNIEAPGTVEVRVIGLDKKGTPTGTSTWRLAGQPCGRPWALSGPQVHCRGLQKTCRAVCTRTHSISHIIPAGARRRHAEGAPGQDDARGLAQAGRLREDAPAPLVRDLPLTRQPEREM